MNLIKFLQKKPSVLRNDPILHVINLMNKFSAIEIPVLDKENLIGTISSRTILNALKKFDIKNILAGHLAEEKFIKVNVETDLGKLISQFLEKKNCIACIYNGKFKGFVERKKLLELLFDSQEKIDRIISTDFISIDINDSIKKLSKVLEKGLPLLVLKDEEPLDAFSLEELCFSLSISDCVVRKIERDFETLRAEKRKLLRLRLNQQLLSFLKGEADFTYFHPIRVNSILNKTFVLSGNETVGEVAKIMLSLNKSVLPVKSKGIVSDLALLSELK